MHIDILLWGGKNNLVAIQKCLIEGRYALVEAIKFPPSCLSFGARTFDHFSRTSYIFADHNSVYINRSNDTCEDLHKCHPEVQENLPGVASPMKSASTSGILEQAACDYLTKLENGYSDNPSDKDYFCRNMSSFIDGGRLSKFNDLLIKDWTTATLHESSYAMHVSSGYLPREMAVGMGSERHPCKGHNYSNTESGAPYGNAVGEHAGAIGLHHNRNKIISCGGGTSLEDLVSFGSRLISQPSLDVKLPRLGYSPNTKKLPAGPKNTSPVGNKEHICYCEICS